MTTLTLVRDGARQHDITEPSQTWRVPVVAGRVDFAVTIAEAEHQDVRRMLTFKKEAGVLHILFPVAVSGNVQVWVADTTVKRRVV